jgi:transmembrane sensor
MYQLSNRKMNFENISENEKSILGKRIKYSIQNYKSRKQKYYSLFAAASVVLILSLVIYSSLNENHSPIEKFAESVKNHNNKNEVELILEGDKNIIVKESDSIISYSSLGKKVSIGVSETIAQETTNKNEITYNTLLVPQGKRKQIILSDGTKVWLNSGSKLIFPAYFSENKREVYLEGEAIFEVVHNAIKPFFVKASQYSVEVLGTVFNISNYKEDATIRTVLKSGSVKINYENSSLLSRTENLKISPGTLAVYHKNNKEIITEEVHVDKYFSWIEGVFIFKNDSLSEIMKKLSRYYDLEIIINDRNLAKHTFSGYLDVKKDIHHILNTIITAENSSFKYEITTDRKLIIN